MSSFCSLTSNISVTVFATNILGNGSVTTSEPKLIGNFFFFFFFVTSVANTDLHAEGVNRFLYVKITSENIRCIVHNNTEYSLCHINKIYGLANGCDNDPELSEILFTSNFNSLEISQLPKAGKFCFEVVGFSGISDNIILLRGSFSSMLGTYYITVNQTPVMFRQVFLFFFGRYKLNNIICHCQYTLWSFISHHSCTNNCLPTCCQISKKYQVCADFTMTVLNFIMLLTYCQQ